VGTLSAFTIVSVCLLVLRYVPPLDASKPVIPARTPEGLPVVPKSPSRPIFTSQYPIFSPVLTILSEASLHTLPGRSIVGDFASSASSTGSLLQDEAEDLEEETPNLAESSPTLARVDLQNPLLLPEPPNAPGTILPFCDGQYLGKVFISSALESVFLDGFWILLVLPIMVVEHDVCLGCRTR
jgi:hypothetical protein